MSFYQENASTGPKMSSTKEENEINGGPMQLMSSKSQAFILRGRLYTHTVLKLLVDDMNLISMQLNEIISKAPKMFDNVSIILDCTDINETSFDLHACYALMRERQIHPIALQGAQGVLLDAAKALNLGIMQASSAHDKMIPLPESSERDAPEFKSKLHSHPVRSGQQLTARHGDLIVAAFVSQGAELMSEGNIHVYGTLRGRALAGMSGDRTARIFCLNLEAELVSIAGIYRLRDTFENEFKGPCQIYLVDDHIQIESLC